MRGSESAAAPTTFYLSLNPAKGGTDPMLASTLAVLTIVTVTDHRRRVATAFTATFTSVAPATVR